MKSEDLQNIVLSKYQNGDTPTKNFRDLNGGIDLRTIKRWCQMILQSVSITLSSLPGCPRLARTKGNIRKVKNRLRRKTEYQLENCQWSSIFPKEVLGEY
ncbi:unnamed protein product [Rotaria magnacalcarata]|uniref:Uncharacterized protein n=2 Tax=Rotaria magnacalcarata TaxID=392030 RepID=A0A815XY16_9BILA|nr:unnamed protein product [Rotaria magnacalcarata]CAF1636462.1 unnamed protein product [Rotaria magnacalcarata]CAF4659950.1 unnamed protein product [Rotaria magnacalcarata]CAF4660628.1 unnamed protein product [Rotaria magnacalcarata]CAF5005682.1 unnamed protein product [Rotaria magnacalcarata]